MVRNDSAAGPVGIDEFHQHLGPGHARGPGAAGRRGFIHEPRLVREPLPALDHRERVGLDINPVANGFRLESPDLQAGAYCSFLR
jgi:hypothetical protein